MFGVGVAWLIIGYTLLYTGSVNLRNGGQGPTLWQAFGLTSTIGTDAPTAKPAANQTGQPPGTTTPPIQGPIINL